MVQRNRIILWRELAGEAVLLDPQNGCSYSLNSVGTTIWKLLDGVHTAEDIATQLSLSYAVDQEQALHDTEALIADLNNYQLVHSDAMVGELYERV